MTKGRVEEIRIETVDEVKAFLESMGIGVRGLIVAMIGRDHQSGKDARIDVDAGKAFLDRIVSARKFKIPPEVRARIDKFLPDMCEGYSGGTGEIKAVSPDDDSTLTEDGTIADTGSDLLAKYYSSLVDRIIQANRKDVLRSFFGQCRGCRELRIGSRVRAEILGDLQGRVIDAFRNDGKFVDVFPALADGFLDYLFNNRDEIEPRVMDDL